MAWFAAPDQERLRFFMPIAERMEGLARRFALKSGRIAQIDRCERLL
jgi:hypothetical protein